MNILNRKWLLFLSVLFFISCQKQKSKKVSLINVGQTGFYIDDVFFSIKDTSFLKLKNTISGKCREWRFREASDVNERIFTFPDQGIRIIYNEKTKQWKDFILYYHPSDKDTCEPATAFLYSSWTDTVTPRLSASKTAMHLHLDKLEEDGNTSYGDFSPEKVISIEPDAKDSIQTITISILKISD